MGDKSHERYMDLARQAKEKAYAPYSGFCVGACVVDESGKTAIGCNVENASYGATICAERNAIGTAVASGMGRIVSVYISSDTQDPTFPCGICRQVLLECNPAMSVYVWGSDGQLHCHTLQDLLPHAFSKTSLKEQYGPDNPA